MENRTITINSISKTYSVTGWRVGWAIAEKRITERIRKVHDFLTVGAPTPFQHAAVVALSFNEEYYVNLQKHYAKARKLLYSILDKTGFKPYLPKGSYYIITEVDDLMNRMKIDDDFTFSRKLIKATGVATVPGSSFYSNSEKGRTQVRFCFCKKWDTLYAVEKVLKSKF